MCSSDLSASSGATTLYLGELADVDVGDLVSLGIEDLDRVISGIVPSLNAVQLATSLAGSYEAGADVRIDKAADGQWSHALRHDDDADIYRGLAALAAGAAAGARTLQVTSCQPFARGSFIRIHSQTGLDVENYPGTYLVERVRRRDETGGAHELDIRNLEDGGGLVEAASEGDPLTVILNVPPTGLSQRIGQTGVTFGLIGEEGDVWDDTEPPISEGDLVRLSYPGLKAKKNENNRRGASDADSIARYGERKDLRRAANQLMDGELALMDCQRVIRRRAAPRAQLTLSGCHMQDPDDQATLLALEPWDVVTFKSYRLLRDKAGYAVDALVLEHTFHSADGGVDLVVEELDDSAPGGRLAGRDAPPARVDLMAEAGDSEIQLWWDHPVESDFASVMIRWSTKDYPASTTDGELLGVFADGIHSVKHERLANGTPYYYSAFTKDSGGNTSKAAHATGVPVA